MRHTLIFLTLFIAILPFSLTGQAAPAQQTLPREGYVPGELIIHSSSAQTTQDIEGYFQNWNIAVDATQLTFDGTYFLVRLSSRGTRHSPRLELLHETLVERFVCDGIFGNPGEGSEIEVDGVWPNYIIDPGDLYVDNAISDAAGDFCQTVDIDSYNPLMVCPDRRDLPNPQIGSNIVKVAIMDTGLNPLYTPHFFNDFRTGTSIVRLHHVVAADYIETDPERDENGHGTAVAALVAHRFYETGRLGRLQLHSYPILNERGRGTIAALINSLDLAIIEDVDIINLSLGFVGEECDEYVANILAPLFSRTSQADILVFSSAGNNGVELAVSAQYPANSSPSSSKVFTVGASNCDDESTWDESNYDINIVDFTAPGQDIMVPYPIIDCYVSVSGTSFATPLSVSIAAALRTRYSVNRTICLLESRRTPVNNEHIPGTDESRLGSIAFLGNNVVEDCNGDINTGLLANTPGTNSPFPNPVLGTLNVPVTEEEMAANSTLRISDSGGRKLIQLQVQHPLVKISTEGMPAGIYMLSITNEKNTRVIKVIKR